MTSPQFDSALMKRLWQRTERPGCVRPGHAQAILARHTRIAARPSLAELLLRRGHSAEYAAQDAPIIVAARPADVWPETAARSMAATTPLSTAGPAPAPAPTSASAPRPIVQARLARPSDIALPAPVPVRPGPSAKTSSPAGVLRDTESTEAEATVTTRSAPPSSPPTAVTVTVTVPSMIVGQSGHYLPKTTHGHEKGLVEGSQVPVIRERDFYHNGIGTPAGASGGLGGRSPLRAGVPGVVPRAGTVHNGIGRPASSITQRPARLPASIAIAQVDRSAPVPPVSGTQDLSETIAALLAPGPPSSGHTDPTVRGRDPVGRGTDPPGRRADAPSRSANPPSANSPGRRAEPLGRYDDPASRERDKSRPAAPQVDIERIVGTVQRRLAHHMTIERERRGMR